MTKLVHASIFALCAGTAGPAFLATAASAQDDACGRISIAEMNWASAGVAAWVDKIILEEGHGCQVDLVTGDTMPTFTSMNEKGEPDIAPELWVNAVKEPLVAALAEGRLVEAAQILTDGGVEGWWVPKYIVDANPEITTLDAALARPDLFPAPEHPDRGAVMNCPAGWNCQITTANLYRAFGVADKGFDLVDSGSAAGLDGSIANAAERGLGWLGYYWAPTSILGKYEMVKLDFEVPLDMAEFNACTAVSDCAAPKPNAYPVAEVYTVVTKRLAEENPVVIGYLGKRAWSNEVVNGLLAWMDENQATNEDAAWHFLETQPDLWKSWLEPEAATKVEAAL